MMQALWQLFSVFLQIGAFSIGGGYAVIPMIRDQVVIHQGWITQKVFTDIITISQMTPGPLAINTSTFVGLQIAGIPGAVAATLGCIIPGVAAALLSIEGAELLACDPGRVAQAAQWGVRIINPVWNRTNALSGTNLEDPDRGLSAQGRDFIREMEGCGIYADVSHLSDPGFWDLVRMAHRPILASHSNSRAVCPHRRNLTDDMLRAIRNTGGVVGLNLYQSFVGPDETMDGLVRQIEHMLDIAGEETLCIGGDLDGCEKLAGGLRGVEDVPRIWAALAGRGYPRPLLENIFWSNLRRLF